jgi:hypothetical protein
VLEGLDVNAKLIQFPALVPAPVKNIRWHGRYPRGVASLRQARWKRTLAEMEGASDALRESAPQKDPYSLDPRFLAANAGLIALMASKLIADLRALEGKTD